jgi:hypothetical protein
VTGLTCASPLWDLPQGNCCARVVLSYFFYCPVIGSFGVGLLGFVRGFSSWQVVLWWRFLFQGLEEPLRLPGTLLCICCLPPA